MNQPLRLPQNPGAPSYAPPVRTPVPFLPERETNVTTPGQVFGLVLFFLVNLTLFIRPREVDEDLDFLGYETLIIACFVASFSVIYPQFNYASLINRPITICVLGIWFAVILSHLFSPPHHYFFIWGVRESGFKFFKILVYYFLLVGLLDTPPRLRRFLVWLVLTIFLLTILSLLHFHNLMYIQAMHTVFQREEIREGEEIKLEDLPLDDLGNVIEGSKTTVRLVSLGVFSDPNDLCMILVVGMGISLFLMNNPRAGVFGILWLIPAGVFGYAFFLTKSRGGFLAFMTGLLVLFHSRFGFVRSLMLSTIVVPIMLLVFQGRMTSISSTESTAQLRIQLWSEGLGFFREAPLFGIGEDQYAEQPGIIQVAHNTFIHCFAELGFFGGTLFLGAFFFAIWALYRLGSNQVQILDSEQRRLRPYFLAIIAGYATSMLTLSRFGIVPTYMMLGLAASYLRVTKVFPPLADLRFNSKLVRRVVLLSILFLIVTYIYVRVTVRWGA
jgi:hypothetical protein